MQDKGGAKCVKVSTHSRPKAAADVRYSKELSDFVSTHSRPKAAGLQSVSSDTVLRVSTHSRPKAAGAILPYFFYHFGFQHTAARRRLVK